MESCWFLLLCTLFALPEIHAQTTLLAAASNSVISSTLVKQCQPSERSSSTTDEIDTYLPSGTSTMSSSTNVPTLSSSTEAESPGDESYRTAAYYVNWATYARNHQPQDLPAELLTHVLYAFANVNPVTGEVTLSDAYADIERHFPADSWNDAGTNMYGCIKQLFLLKKRNRHLKTLLSIGGSTYSPNFSPPVSTNEGRKTFANSAVKLLGDLGFDGLDIDWEYPTDETEAQNYVSLLSSVREELDLFAQSLPNQPHLLLTVASSCGPDKYKSLKLNEMDRYVDFWNLMAYDFAGSWSTIAGHQANLFNSPQNLNSTPFTADAAIQYYTETAGINASKIVLGMPLYGRTFANTDGPGSSFQGIGNDFSWERGVWDFKALPRPGAREYFDHDAKASWSYDPVDRVMVTYDTPSSAIAKADYIKTQSLGGAMWWETSGDKAGDESLIHQVVQKLAGNGAQRLDSSQNLLEYPSSKYENLRNGFPSG